MVQPYFENFPNMYYNGVLCKDLTRRVNITEGDISSPFLFYPYEIQGELRQDHLAEYYYKDPYTDWLVLLSNQIVDPYFGWYNTNETFNVAVEQLYGSIENAQKKIAFYRNNWSGDETELTPSFYNNILDKDLRKYYQPTFGAGLNIVSYKRKPDDTTMNTNKILQYTISANNGTIALENGELVDLKQTGQDTTIGVGEVETSNSTIVRIKNISGTTTANSSYVLDIVGETSGANVSANAVVTYFENITDAEAVYWEPIYQYDLMIEENEQRKNLKLIGDGVYQLFIDRFRTAIRQDVDESTGLIEE